ncbi:hypothetical protein BTUL_0265g00130 [Botrytis tulipae]|uniref:Uncharacterized protein n=1 Tax=Botrytis tulipae TaxID=87230 RepID=A0A4Z1E623_9HELO|nr:hypothetical protein BTUL_0265g00130 [Botrytis tulipae]
MHYSKLMIIALVGYASGRAILLENPSSSSKRGDDIPDYKRSEDLLEHKRNDNGDYKRGDDIAFAKRQTLLDELLELLEG